MGASSDTLNSVTKANKVVNFPIKTDIESVMLSPTEVMKLRTWLGSMLHCTGA